MGRTTADEVLRRRFRDEYKRGDRVAIIRHRHGWEDGRVVGTVVSLEPATVRSDDGVEYGIAHPRDVRPTDG